jgi:hypothetical protein
VYSAETNVGHSSFLYGHLAGKESLIREFNLPKTYRDTAYYLLHLQPPFSIGRQLRLVYNLSHHGTQHLVFLRVERVHSMIVNLMQRVQGALHYVHE